METLLFKTSQVFESPEGKMLCAFVANEAEKEDLKAAKVNLTLKKKQIENVILAD